VAPTGDRRGAYRVLVERRGLRERAHLKDLGIDERLIFIWIFQK
jgi:hypothetical protein